MSKVYVASSWRNEYYYQVLNKVIEGGHNAWDWRMPPTGGNGFRWQDCGQTGYQHGDKVKPSEWRALLAHERAQAGFAADMAGIYWCDVGVLLHPCGRSAHLEAGLIAGSGKKVHVLAPENVEPDLMVLALRGGIFDSIDDLIAAIAR